MKNRVRELRTERGWTQADLAKRLDVSRNSVIAIENGKYDPLAPAGLRDIGCLRPDDRGNLPAEMNRLSAAG
jgi:putative transcriptional regulator